MTLVSTVRAAALMASGLAVLGVAACAGGAGEGAAPRAAAATPEADGKAYAQAWCSTCHAIEAGRASPRPSAPPFTVLRVRFNPLTWERAMAGIAAGGHDEMPRLVVAEPDQRALKAYIDSLR